MSLPGQERCPGRTLDTGRIDPSCREPLELMHEELRILSGRELVHMDAVGTGFQLQFEGVTRVLARSTGIHEDQRRARNTEGDGFQGRPQVGRHQGRQRGLRSTG